MRKKIDATQGSLIKLIFIYTIPLIVSAILQNMFHIADKAVLGNMAGPVAVASISATGTVTELIISGAVGLSVGTSIVLARLVGQKDKKRIRETIDTSLITSVSLGLVVAIVGFIFAPTFLAAVDCPAECYEGALLYMRIYLAAAPASLLYNYGSAILRAIGDTRRPLIYVCISGVFNVILNIVLCLVLQKNKVAAVAIATVSSNCISACLILRRLCHLDDSAKVTLSRMRFSLDALRCILRFGIPSTISSLVHPIGNLQIMTTVNSYGPEVMAGFTSSVSVDTIPRSFANSFGSATTTFIGQNLGANKTERVKKSFWYFLGINFLITGTIGVFLFFTGEFWISIIIGKVSKIAIEHAMIRMLHVTLFMFVYAINTVLLHAIQAFGYPTLITITNILFNLVFRVLWMQFIYPLKPEFATLPLCFTFSWILSMTFYAIFFFFVYRRYVKKGICKKI